MGNKTSEYFDFAISVAHENIDIAQKLRERLMHFFNYYTGRKLRVFLYSEYQAYLAGKRRDEAFGKIFGEKTKYVLTIISNKYKNSDGCIYELNVAKKESKQRTEEFIIPLRIDDTQIYGLSEEIYQKLSSDNIDEIALLLVKKITSSGEIYSDSLDEDILSEKQKQPVLLTSSEQKILGIIATSIIPFEKKLLIDMIPNIKWENEIRKLRRKGLIEKGTKQIIIKRKFLRIILSDENDKKDYHRFWIKALSRYSYSLDLGILLSIHLMSIGKIDEGLRTITDIADNIGPGYWNDIYLGMLEKIYKEKPNMKIMKETRLHLLNTIGKCMTNAARYKESIEFYSRLRKYSKKVKSTSGMGLSLINSGVAYYEQGYLNMSKSYYKKSIKYAQEIGDNSLLGRASTNLGMILIDENIEQAKEMLNKGFEINKKLNDKISIAHSYLGLGILSVEENDLVLAIRYFEKAEKIANKYGLKYLKSIIVYNLANGFWKTGQIDKSRKYYKDTRNIAEEGGFINIEIKAIKGEAILAFKTGDYKNAEILFTNLSEKYKETGNTEERILAINDTGLSQLLQKKDDIARKTLGNALSLSRRFNMEDLIALCRYNYGISFAEMGDPKTSLKKLKRYAKTEENYGNLTISGDLYISYANLLADYENNVGVLKNAINLLNKYKSILIEPYQIIGLNLILGEMHYITKDFEKAKDNLLIAKKMANRAGDKRALVESSELISALYKDEKKFELSDEQLIYALDNTEFPENKAILLRKRMEIYLEKGDEKSAEKIFKTAKKLVEKNNNIEVYIDLLMSLGDYYWEKGKRTQYIASKFYIWALFQGFKLSDLTEDELSFIKVYLSIGMHLVMRLFYITTSERIKRIAYLENRLERFLSRQNKSTDIDLIKKYLLWPFKLANNFSEVCVDGRKPTDQEIIWQTEQLFMYLFNAKVDLKNKEDQPIKPQ